MSSSSSSFNFNSLHQNKNMENILNNNDYKLIFLKAILLGINYGSSNNVNYYVQSIESEINNINMLKSKNNDKELKNNNKELKNNDTELKNNDIEKHEKILLQLENTKNLTLLKIQKFSNNHYASNYSRITFLQNNLNIINQEIIKNKLIIKKYKDNLLVQSQKNNKLIKNKFNQNINTENNGNNNRSSLLFSEANMKETSSLYSKIKKNEYVGDNQKVNNNQTLVGELEKTLDNLSNLFV